MAKYGWLHMVRDKDMIWGKVGRVLQLFLLKLTKIHYPKPLDVVCCSPGCSYQSHKEATISDSVGGRVEGNFNQVFNSVDKSSKSPLVNGTFEYSTYATMGVLKAAEEAHQVADLGKCLGLTFRANEAKFLQKLIEVEVFEDEGKFIALS